MRLWRTFTRAFWLAFEQARNGAPAPVAEPDRPRVSREDALSWRVAAMEARMIAVEDRVFGDWGIRH